jgi:hypothetical protein
MTTTETPRGPIVIYGLMPYVHRARGRMLTRRAG